MTLYLISIDVIGSRFEPSTTSKITNTTQRNPLKEYSFQTGVNLKQDFTLLIELQGRSVVDCASECTASTLGCDAFEYNSTESKCRLYSVAPGGFGTQGSDAVFIANKRDPLKEYSFQTGVNLKHDFTLLKELQGQSVIDCASECTASTMGCDAFEYNSTESKCRLYSVAPGGFGTQGSDAVFIANKRGPLKEYSFQTGVNLKHDFTLLKELQGRSVMACASECTASSMGCNAFEYNSTESKCILYSVAPGVSGTNGSDTVFIANEPLTTSKITTTNKPTIHRDLLKDYSFQTGVNITQDLTLLIELQGLSDVECASQCTVNVNVGCDAFVYNSTESKCILYSVAPECFVTQGSDAVFIASGN
jgi:hypothetical protein